MKLRRNGALPRNWKEVFHESAEHLDWSLLHLDEPGHGEYGLGISFTDIGRILKSAERTKYWEAKKVIDSRTFSAKAVHRAMRKKPNWRSKRVLPQTRAFVNDETINNTLMYSLTRLNAKQREAVSKIATEVSKNVDAPIERFSEGFGIYIQMALDGNKLPEGFNLGSDDILELYEKSKAAGNGVYQLEQTARKQLPLLAEFTDGHYNDSDTQRLFLAGAGLAYEQCFGLFWSSEEAAAKAYDAANGINPQG